MKPTSCHNITNTNSADVLSMQPTSFQINNSISATSFKISITNIGDVLSVKPVFFKLSNYPWVSRHSPSGRKQWQVHLVANANSFQIGNTNNAIDRLVISAPIFKICNTNSYV